MGKMVDMTRDPRQLDEMVSNYDPEYPIGFFLDSRMVDELGLKDAKPDQKFNIKGCIKVKSTTETGDKKELYVTLKSLAVDGAAEQTATDKMSETYKDGTK